MPVEEQVILLFCGIQGYLDDIAVNGVTEFENKILEHIRINHKKLLAGIKKEKKLTDESISQLKKIITDFKTTFNG